METVFHTRIGQELEVVSVDPAGQWIECISPKGEPTKYGMYVFEGYKSTYELVSDILTEKGIEFTVSKSAKSESAYYKFGSHQIRVSAHENGCTYPYIRIESGSREADVRRILAENNI